MQRYGIQGATKMDVKKLQSQVCRMSGKAHSPAIVNRCGGPTAEELNICGICGCDLTLVRGVWIAITDEQAYSIRGKKS